MRLEVNQDGVKNANSLGSNRVEWPYEIKANNNFMVQLEERLETS